MGDAEGTGATCFFLNFLCSLKGLKNDIPVAMSTENLSLLDRFAASFVIWVGKDWVPKAIK